MNMSVLVMKNTIHPIDKWYSFLVLSLQKTASLLIAVNAQSQKIKLQHQEAFLSFHLYKICSLALLKTGMMLTLFPYPFIYLKPEKKTPLSGKAK